MGKSIDRQTAKNISQEIADFVDSLEIKYGIKAGKRSTRYQEASVKVTIDCVIAPEHRDIGVLTPAEEAYDINRSIEGLPARGSVIVNGYGESFKIKEWIVRGRKYKVLVEKVGTDKRYKFTTNQVRLSTVK